MKKETTIQLIVIVILVVVLGILLFFVVSNSTMKNNMQRLGSFELEENTVKETSAEDIDEGTIVTESEIDLSDYSTNITINEAGEYVLSGDFEHSVLINAESDVTLVLNGVNIQNEVTAAIVNISTNDLTIIIEENTTNTLSDGGSSEYDACVYSNGNIIIEGEGTLNVYGNQEEGEGIATESKDITINSGTINIESEDDGINAGGDGGTITINGGTLFIKANGDGIDSNKDLIINGGEIYTMGSTIGGDSGIDTDDGFEINGGTVIALGSDMLEEASSSSTQKSIAFQLSDNISEGSKVIILKDDEDEVISFEAEQDFRTLIVSNEKVTSGTYYLYIDGEKTEYKVEVN